MFIVTMDGKFPMLEYLHIGDPDNEDTSLVLPTSFLAPRLLHIMLAKVGHRVGSSSLTTAVGLVSLYLGLIPLPAGHLFPNDILLCLSYLLRLETIAIIFPTPLPNDDVGTQHLNMPTTTHVILPKLRLIMFRGFGDYLETFTSRITTPLLEHLQMALLDQPAIAMPHFHQFMATAVKLRFNCARLHFGDECTYVRPYPSELLPDELPESFIMQIHCMHLGWQVASMAEI
jgi:hypothetical protein